MIRRSIAASAVAVLTLGLIPAATAAPRPDSNTEAPELEAAPATISKSQEKGTVLSLGEGKGRELYIVQLEDAAVPSYEGGVKGLAPVRTKDRTFAHDAAPERAYRRHVLDEQKALRSDIARITGRPADVRFSYTDAVNGIAVRLTRDEALEVSDLNGVAAVQVDEVRELQTDRGPEWIGAPGIWSGDATPSGTGTKGEGIVAGILDSGINPANPSFAATVSDDAGGDGYVHENPRGAGNYVGVCDSANDAYIADWGCNDKLIGAWDFAPVDGTNPYDNDGHGTHTASTTAGNQVEATTYSAEENPDERFDATRTIKGVAPHANVIAYDVCSGGCPLTAILAGIDQAIADEVDVINYSIGSSDASAPWSDADALGFLNARAAGIHVATSAGNDGPGEATVGSPGDVPWMTTVGATQHDRQWQATVQDITATGGETLPDIEGLAFANATDGSFPLVYAGDAPYDNPLCGIDGGTAGDGTFPAGTDLTGLIVVCDRGVSGRVEKGHNVAGLGAEGMILVNDAASGDSLNADPHALPAVHVTHADGTALKEWMGTVEGEQASLSGAQEHIGDDVADIMAGFSSRGPNRAVEMISPSISAPGVDILAGNGTDNEVSWGFISGTSMASPHIAGSLALLASANPDWTPAEAQSALMTTAVTEVADTDGSAADWFDMGSGRVDLTKASNAGLVLDETEADYLAADPTVGGDVKGLNTASMADTQCLETCTWTRTVTATETGAGSWTAAGSAITDGIEVTVAPDTFDLEAGETQEITVTADVAGASTDAYQFGNVVLTPAEGSAASPAHLPVAALPSTGIIPAEIDIDTRRDAGSQESQPIESVAISELDIQAHGLVPAEVEPLTIEQDPTNDDPFDEEGGTAVVTIDVPDGATRLVASLKNPTATDFDLFVGTGEVAEANVVADSTSPGSDESVDIALQDGDEGEWWILVQNWEASEVGGTDTVDLEHAVVGGDAGNLHAEGPASNPAGEPYTLRTFWDEPEMDAGETWYGSLTVSAAPGGTLIGTIPVTVNRLQDDVAKTVDAETAAPGDTLTYTVEVQPNVTPEDMTYTFRDRLPDGTTYVEGSGPEGATVEDGVLTWETELPTPVGAEGHYVWSTSETDESCVNPFDGTGYVDLAAFNIRPQSSLVGDGVMITALTDRSYGFYEQNQSGLSFTDDGFLVYGGPDYYTGDITTPQQLPDTAAPNNIAAMLWQDMQLVYDAAAGSGVSIATAGAGLGIIEYDDLRLADDPTGAQGTLDMEVFAVTGSRDLWFAYDNVTAPVDAVTIGAENADGTNGSALVNAGDAAGAIGDDVVVCAKYSKEVPPEVFTYEVTVDDGVANGQVLRNELEHSVDNPGAKAVTVSQDVTVDGVVTTPDPKVTVKKVRDAVERGPQGVVVFTRPKSALGQKLTVTYKIGGTAKRGKDFRGLDGTVTFARNARQSKELVKALRRPGIQKVKVVKVQLVAGDGYSVGKPKVARVKIKDKTRR